MRNVDHFLSILFQKNSKGRLRDIAIIPRLPKHEWKSGGTRRAIEQSITKCRHCNIPMAAPSGASVVGGICVNCRERERLVRISA